MYKVKFFEIEIPQRVDYEIEVLVTDMDGRPVDLSGSAPSFLIGQSVKDQSPAVIPGSVVDAVGGRLLFVLTDDDTNLTGDHYGEAFLVGPTGNRSVVAQGIIKFVPTNQGG